MPLRTSPLAGEVDRRRRRGSGEGLAPSWRTPHPALRLRLSANQGQHAETWKTQAVMRAEANRAF
jgi:hypothetical protein